VRRELADHDAGGDRGADELELHVRQGQRPLPHPVSPHQHQSTRLRSTMSPIVGSEARFLAAAVRSLTNDAVVLRRRSWTCTRGVVVSTARGSALDGLGFEVLLEAVTAELAAVTGLLVAAEGGRGSASGTTRAGIGSTARDFHSLAIEALVPVWESVGSLAGPAGSIRW
jgi:hypothetical protein